VLRRVLVAGIGALGSELVRNLELLSCDRVFVADPDLLEEKNIARSWLMRDGAVGESKVSHAIEKLQKLFPQIEWRGAAVEIADVELEELEDAEILFSCVDTDLARMEIAALAARYGFDVCDAGLGGTSTRVGRASWFPSATQAACFACLLSGSRRAELLSEWESVTHACWAAGSYGDHKWTSTPETAAMVARRQVEIALAASRDAKSAFSLQLDLDACPVERRIEHMRSAGCPLHEDARGDVFPVCTLAECGACAAEFAPMRRLAWVRRRGVCPRCGSKAVVIRESGVLVGNGG
jgi:adenylyltransferase/sulfurtransferase